MLKNTGTHNVFIGSCCGNKFIIWDCHKVRLSKKEKIDFAKKYIRKHKVDSALFLEKSKKAEVFMEIFERDGSESESCGNGAILVAFLLKIKHGNIETRGANIKIQTRRDKEAILAHLEVADISNHLKKEGYVFVKIGEPHAVYITDGNMQSFPLVKIGKRTQRHHPRGVNVDVIKNLGRNRYAIRTYERGVYDETKSCGTGSLASFVTVYFLHGLKPKQQIEFISRGGKHWVSKENAYYKLETLKKFIKVKPLKTL
ncbi:MAG: hypothetical protein WC750_05395 [Patescibacteria group bacterium]|jgi:diaminopimelate epimerase